MVVFKLSGGRALRRTWIIERIDRKGALIGWRAERRRFDEVLEDLWSANDAGEGLRFAAPAHASDGELDYLLENGARPNFYAVGQDALWTAAPD
jgi:hypothetical protein